MRVNRLSLAVTGALVMVLTTGAQAEPRQYLCIVESAAGLHYDAQTEGWKSQAFGAGRKYVLRRLNDDDSVLIRWNDENLKKFLSQNKPKPSWAFFEYGKDLPKDVAFATCLEGIEVAGFETSSFFCQREVSDANFDKDSRRFEIVYHGGYISQGFWEQFRREYPDTYKRQLSQGSAIDPSHPADLFIEIGKCSPP